jgi:signal transduction histidine kinase
MIFRFNLIQRFVFLNLVWLAGMGLYFGYWFSDELVETVTRLQSIDLAGALRLDIDQRFSLVYFDTLPPDSVVAEERLKQIDDQLSTSLRTSEYPVQILWDQDNVIWSNQRNLIGKTLEMDSVLSMAFQGQDRAKLETGQSPLMWMWNALAHEDHILNETTTTSYLRILIPIRFNRDQIIDSVDLLTSESLKKLIKDTIPPQRVIPGVLELHKNPHEILKNAVGTVKSIWKRVLVVTMLTFIALFSLFKSAFNTIERQSRQLREQERLSHLGKMASYLAHEIRNPLFIIRGSAQNLEELAEEDSIGKKLSKYIIEEVDRLNNMVRDLLGLAKPTLLPSRNPTSLAKAIQDTNERSLRQAPKIELVTQLDPTHDLIWFNRDQLVQVFTNLFRNARDACRGQGTILVESRVAEEGNLQIRITDDGPGIPESDLPMIFEPFFSKKENGIGLGLAIVKHLVTGNNATIDAVKPPSAGACFILTVRLAPEGTALIEQGENQGDPQGSPETEDKP